MPSYMVEEETSGDTTTYTYEFSLVLKNSEEGYDIRSEEYSSEEAIKDGITDRDGYIEMICESISFDEGVINIIKYFNTWLTMSNQYNTSEDLNEIDESCRQSICALAGKNGKEGPVSESYARAFKVLCDYAGIPCVLVDGLASPSEDEAGEGHMWNYVEVNEKWYGVDISWNDPSGGDDCQVSGSESKDYLLVGADTEIKDMKFKDSHSVTNQVSAEGVCFSNGPELNSSQCLAVLSNPDIRGVYGQTIGEFTFTEANEYGYVYGRIWDVSENEIEGTWEVHEDDKDLILEVNTEEYVDVVFTPEDKKFEPITVSIQPWVERKNLTDEDILVQIDETETIVYNGMEQVPNVIIIYDRDKDGEYTPDCDWVLGKSDYSVNCYNNINPSDEAECIIEGIANYEGIIEKLFTIEKALQPAKMPDASMEVSYDMTKVADVELEGSWTWQEEDKEKELISGEEVRATAIYNGEDVGNYEVESIEVTIIRQSNTDDGNTDDGTTDNGTTDNGTTDEGTTDDPTVDPDDDSTTDNDNTDNGNTGGGTTDNGTTDDGDTDNPTVDPDDDSTTDNGTTDDGSTVGPTVDPDDDSTTDNDNTDNGNNDNGTADTGNTNNSNTNNGNTDNNTSVVTPTEKKIGSVTLSKTIYTYKGKALKPSVTAKDTDDKVVGSENYKLEYFNNTNVGTAKVKLTFSGDYAGNGTIEKAFIINPKGTKISKLKAGKKKLTIKVKEQKTQISGYQIRYSLKKNMSKAKLVKLGKKTSKTIFKLRGKKTYYVQVRTYKKVSGKTYYSAWSKAVSKKVKK